MHKPYVQLSYKNRLVIRRRPQIRDNMLSLSKVENDVMFKIGLKYVHVYNTIMVHVTILFAPSASYKMADFFADKFFTSHFNTGNISAGAHGYINMNQHTLTVKLPDMFNTGHTKMSITENIYSASIQ